jgi:hypothetical protein
LASSWTSMAVWLDAYLLLSGINACIAIEYELNFLG